MNLENIISLIESRIERCEHTIASNPGVDNIGVRISAQGKILLLREIIRDIKHGSEMIDPMPIQKDKRQLDFFLPEMP